MQGYLKSSDIKIEDKYLLFALRSRTTESLANFKTMHGDISCKLCELDIPQTDKHLLECSKIIENCPRLYNNINTEYEDIFSDIDKQKDAVLLYKEVFKTKMDLGEGDMTR